MKTCPRPEIGSNQSEEQPTATQTLSTSEDHMGNWTFNVFFILSLSCWSMTFSKLFDGLSGCQLFCAFCFLISSFFVAPNPYAGFVAIFTGLFSIFHIVGSWYFLRRNIGLATYGAVLGSSCVMVFVYIETAVFFGQYSACETPDYHYYGYLRRYGTWLVKVICDSLCTFFWPHLG